MLPKTILKVNAKVSNSQTGDNVLLYIVIGLMSVIGIAGSTIYIKKRNN